MFDRHWSGNHTGVNRCRRLNRVVGVGKRFLICACLASALVVVTGQGPMALYNLHMARVT